MNGFPRCAPLLAAACLGFLAGCHTFKVPGFGNGDKTEKAEKEEVLARPGKFSFRVSQFVFYSDFEIKRDQPIFRELADLREHVYKELQLPPPGGDTLIHVYLFGDKDSYDRFIQSAYAKLHLPDRRAFFMEEQSRGLSRGELLVYTFWSDRIRLDLRHELTHALLHCVLKEVPLWLDEGLAEYYELPPSWHGLNRTHVQMMRDRGVRPDLARLEQLSEVKDMDSDRYREAWAWVYLMLRGGNPKAKEALLTYLQQLRTRPNPTPLQPRLAEAVPALDDSLDRLLARLADDRSTGKR
jgi:hypothetical protein